MQQTQRVKASDVRRRTTGAFFWRATSVGVSAIAVGGFVLSFSTLRDLAIRSGIPPELAFIWPLIVDGFILVATAAAWTLRNQARGTWYPWAALVLFSGISVAGNALHASMVRTVDVNYWVATVVSAIPSVAQILASHLLVVMARARETQRQYEEGQAAALKLSQRRASEAATCIWEHIGVASQASNGAIGVERSTSNSRTIFQVRWQESHRQIPDLHDRKS